MAGGCGNFHERDITEIPDREWTMHFVISGTWGPTDPTRAMLPFIFAASAVQGGDTVTLMLFHDAVLMAVDGAGAKLVPVGPPNRYEEVVSHPNMILWACRPCVDARGLALPSLDQRVKLGGMNEFHAAAKQPELKDGRLLEKRWNEVAR